MRRLSERRLLKFRMGGLTGLNFCSLCAVHRMQKDTSNVRICLVFRKQFSCFCPGPYCQRFARASYIQLLIEPRLSCGLQTVVPRKELFNLVFQLSDTIQPFLVTKELIKKRVLQSLVTSGLSCPRFSTWEGQCLLAQSDFTYCVLQYCEQVKKCNMVDRIVVLVDGSLLSNIEIIHTWLPA